MIGLALRQTSGVPQFSFQRRRQHAKASRKLSLDAELKAAGVVRSMLKSAARDLSDGRNLVFSLCTTRSYMTESSHTYATVFLESRMMDNNPSANAKWHCYPLLTQTKPFTSAHSRSCSSICTATCTYIIINESMLGHSM